MKSKKVIKRQNEVNNESPFFSIREDIRNSLKRIRAENKELKIIIEHIRSIWEHIDGGSSGNYINDFYVGVLEGILEKAEALKEKEA